MLYLRWIKGQQIGCIRVYSLMRGLQNCLDAGRLSGCGTTQQSRSYQWMIGCRQLSSVHHSAAHSPATHLPLVRPLTTLLHCNSASPIQLHECQFHPLFTVVRFRRRKMNRKQDKPDEVSAEDEVCLLYTSPSPRD